LEYLGRSQTRRSPVRTRLRDRETRLKPVLKIIKIKIGNWIANLSLHRESIYKKTHKRTLNISKDHIVRFIDAILPWVKG
jgi:hypothetical protein